MKMNVNVQLGHERKCIVCGEPVHFFSRDSEPVCLRAECKLVLSRKKHMSQFAYKQYFSLQSAQIKRTTEFLALREKRLEEKRKAEKKENISCWMKAINLDEGYDPKFYPYVVIPTNSKKISSLPKQRKNLFREHLSGLITETMSELAVNNENTEENQIEEDFLNESEGNAFFFEVKACSLCRGGCCGLGEEHAFLKKETVLRYVSMFPDHKPEQIPDAYLAYLPEKSFEDSCVNHIETGCTLPRDMRSNVCNGYLCDPLVKIRDLFTSTPEPKGVFFISRAQNNWNKDNLDVDNRIIRTELILNDL